MTLREAIIEFPPPDDTSNEEFTKLYNENRRWVITQLELMDTNPISSPANAYMMLECPTHSGCGQNMWNCCEATIKLMDHLVAAYGPLEPNLRVRAAATCAGVCAVYMFG